MKKFLSLVLALVMTMSLVTVASAKDFTDDSKITYGEAVDVMSAIGVIDGYTDGSFRPTNTLTRGAAAKIICNLILGPTEAEDLVANTAPFSDVPADSTFAGYIAYCVSEGIISGYADGTFRPAASLTGYAFMKMLLGALGYDALAEGYTGNNWGINVAKRALNIDLDKGLTGKFNGTKAVTREEACLYAFNTLQAQMVEYDNDSTITIGDIVISNNSKAEGKEDKNGNDILFMDEYFEDLEKITVRKNDVYGRPAHTWEWDDEEIGTYADTADYVVVLDAAYDTLDKVTKYVQDETGNDDLSFANCTATWLNGAYNGVSEEDVAAAAKAGTVVEMFCDDKNNEDDVTTAVIYKYTLAKIESVSSKVSTTASKKGATTAIKFDGVGKTYYDEYKGVAANKLPGFDAETYVKGAYIVLVENDNAIIDSFVAETVTGEITSYKNANSGDYAYIDGVKYVANSDVDFGALKFDEEYTLYLDPNDYVLKIDGKKGATIDDVFYITGVWQKNDTKSGRTYYAETVSLNGVTEDKVIAASMFTANNAIFANKGSGSTIDDSVAGLYTMTLNSDDEYVVEAFANDNADYDLKSDTSLNDAVKDTASSDTYDTNGKFYFTEDTQIISIKTKSTGAVKEVKTAEGGMSMVAGVGAYAITKDGKKDALYVIYVGTGVSAAVDTGDVVYVDAVSSEKDSADTYKTSVWFVEELLEDDISVETENAKAVGFYTYAINDDGNYELTPYGETAAEVDEDYTGWMYVIFRDESIHNTTVSFESGSKKLVDVEFGGATVIDLRDEDTLETAYTYEYVIDSAAELIDASEVSAGILTATYIVDGEITFISVLDQGINKV